MSCFLRIPLIRFPKRIQVSKDIIKKTSGISLEFIGTYEQCLECSASHCNKTLLEQILKKTTKTYAKINVKVSNVTRIEEV